MFGVSRFKDKVVVIAGAEHPLGASLCERLATFGATVVAIGWTDTALLEIARRSPSRIEPLALSHGRRDVLTLLREAWGDEPLHVYVDLMPICDSALNDAPQASFGQSAGMASALLGGMRAGRARGIMAVPQTVDEALTEVQGRSAGYTVLMQRFAREARPARLLGLGLPGPGFVWGADVITSAGDTVMALSHEVSRGIRSGTVVDWAIDA